LITTNTVLVGCTSHFPKSLAYFPEIIKTFKPLAHGKLLGLYELHFSGTFKARHAPEEVFVIFIDVTVILLQPLEVLNSVQVPEPIGDLLLPD